MESSFVESSDEIRTSIGLTRIKFNIKFGKVLVDKGVVTDDEMDRALENQALGKKNGQNPLIGDIISRQYGVSRNDIEKAFAEHLFTNLVRHFQYVLLHDPILISYFGAKNNFLEKLSIRIPFWEVEGSDRSLIKGKAVFLLKPKNIEEISVSLPFDYFVEDQVSNIDFIGGMEYLKSQIIDSKGGITDFDFGDIGIQIDDLKKA